MPVTPIESESDGDDVVKKKTPSYKRPGVKWDVGLTFSKGLDAKRDDDERNSRILAVAWELMESSKLYKLPGHKSNATDLGMWNSQRNGRSMTASQEFLRSVHYLANLVVSVK